MGREGNFVMPGSGKWKSAMKDESGISGFGGVISFCDWFFRG